MRSTSGITELESATVHKHRVLFYDLETSPRLAFIWGPADGWVPQQRMIHDTKLISWAARWQGTKKVLSDVLTPDEAVAKDDTRIVASIADLMSEADIVVAHSVDKFDLPVINTRLAHIGLEPLPPIKTIDTLTKARKTFRLSHNNLDYLARTLGLETKDDTDWDLWEDCYYGDPKALKRMVKYNRQDVRVLEQVYDRLFPYFKGLPRMVDAGSVDEPICPSCGGEDLQRRGFYRTNASTFRKFQCQNPTCGRWSRARAAEKDLKVGTVPL